MKKALLFIPLALAACKEPEPKPVIVMMGDSHIEMGDWQSLTRKCTVANLGHGGDTTALVAAKIPEARAYSPRAVYVMAGINDAYQNISASVSLKSLHMIEDELPNVKFIPPSTLTQERSEKDGVRPFLFSDISYDVGLPDRLFDDGMRIKPEYSLDGLHLNENGYKLWYKQMKAEFKRIGC